MRWSRVLALAASLAFLVVSAGCRGPVVARDASRAGDATVLLVADIHFDPLANPALARELAATPPSRWDAVFATDPNPKESGYETDTNAVLLHTSLAAMRAAAPTPRVVVIAGDFLAHGFRGRYERASGRGDEASYERFVDATIAYLAGAFDRIYPRAQFVVTVGNNDTYCTDYNSTPGSPFLSHWARAWQPLVDRDGAAPDFARSFSRGGWYEASLPFEHTRALVPNSVYWSPGFTNECGDPREAIGREQARDLTRRLAARPPQTRWWLVTHIPPGVDTFASLRGLGLRSMYRPAWLAAFLRLRTSGGRAFDLIIAGHTHMNAFRLARGAGGREVAPVLLLPSITRFGGNDPAFLVATVRPDGTIADYTAYHDSARFFGLGGRSWSTEYRFDEAFGASGVDAASLARVQSRLESDEVLRDRFYGQWYASGSLLGLLVRSTWHRTWCAQAELDVRSYLRCRGKN